MSLSAAGPYYFNSLLQTGAPCGRAAAAGGVSSTVPPFCVRPAPVRGAAPIARTRQGEILNLRLTTNALLIVQADRVVAVPYGPRP
ncbi:hypothetical protein J2Z79_000754 [Symbiobacterium terraclitae]|uniref:Uncharacterized protein n=1 Tax=Symbiobacterium terraclitae TaxID=557451 RepID=A0ABS4JR51_9FIRM|nr:hypothetical protein [Symbiobacterium terraclitae]MBP2017371.1 hypothetical protein [Symbiobacterium terraclitae]